MEKDTVAMHFVVAAVDRLSAPARQRVLLQSNIPFELLSARHARVTANAFAALWLAVAREMDDEFFGLDARRMKVGSFALLCHSVLHCSNLDQAIKRLLRGFAIFLDEVKADLKLEGPHAVIQVFNQIADPAARRFADETFLVLVHGLMCWLVGQRVALSSAEFAHTRPEHASEYTTLYSQHLQFDAQQTRVRFDAKLLRLPLTQTATSLKVFLRSAPQSVFLKYKNEDSWTARLRKHLRGRADPDVWPVLEDVARALHATPTTLRRRLDAEGTTYQSIKDDLRRDAAIHHLCTSSLSIADIGSLLGFQEPSSFHRAFKKWSGVQPGEYRLRQMKAQPVTP